MQNVSSIQKAENEKEIADIRKKFDSFRRPRFHGFPPNGVIRYFLEIVEDNPMNGYILGILRVCMFVRKTSGSAEDISPEGLKYIDLAAKASRQDGTNLE